MEAGLGDQAADLDAEAAVLEDPGAGGRAGAGEGAGPDHPHPPADQAVGLEQLADGDEGGLLGIERGGVGRAVAAPAATPRPEGRRENGEPAPRKVGQARTIACPFPPQLTRLVFRFMKSIRMNCPSVIVLVKYAFPLQMLATCLTKSTRLRSRASMKVLIMIPLRRQLATSR